MKESEREYQPKMGDIYIKCDIYIYLKIGLFFNELLESFGAHYVYSRAIHIHIYERVSHFLFKGFNNRLLQQLGPMQ